MMLKTVIVDDEKLAIDLLTDYVNKTHFLSLSASFKDALDALAYLSSNAIDLLLLDINMPTLDGLELLSSMSHPPKVIFITAHSEYALQGFKHNAVDYLLKPLKYSDFFKATSKLMLSASTPSSSQQENTSAFTVQSSSLAHQFIFIKVDNHHQRIDLANLKYIEACGDYVVYHCVEDSYIVLQSMGNALDSLPSEDFVRIHRSHIVNLLHVDVVHKDYLEIGTLEFSISKSYQKCLKSRLQRHVP